MQAGRLLLLGAVGGTLFGAMLFAACGGSSENNPGVDAGIDSFVAPDHYIAPVDAGVDSPMIDACAVDADLTNIMFSDADIGDAGGNTSACYACTKSKCGALLDTCTSDCACKSPIAGLFQCLEDDGGLSNCAGGLIGGGVDQNAQNLGICVYTGCQQACGLPSIPDGGVKPDTGVNDSGGTDAPAPTDAADGGG